VPALTQALKREIKIPITDGQPKPKIHRLKTNVLKNRLNRKAGGN
jgi:hypothetical protein